MGAQSVVFEIIHESLMNKDTELSVSALCEIAGVSRSGYYRWVSAEDARNGREQQDRADTKSKCKRKDNSSWKR